MDYMKSFKEWSESSYFNESTKKELAAIAGDEKEIKERFYKNLEFGTGGLRGVIGAGTNRMNIYTVRKATQGLANYINKQKSGQSIVIAHDSRRMSPEFCEEAALVMAANGIKAYVFEELKPTPQLSFAVRHLGCISGIVITASHNPPEYNGYKAYWADGGQIPYPRDEEIINEVNAIESFEEIKYMPKQEAIEKGLFCILSKEIDDEYIKNVKMQSAGVVNPEGLSIVYTPLHGTGNKPVRRVLSELGFTNVTVVPEQEMPDENFSTVDYPNPEDPKAFTLAQALATKINADIIVGTDPDADRVGAMVKVDGEWKILTGNMMGVMLAEYILTKKKENNSMPANPVIISTIVSTDMTKAICAAYGVKYVEVLTGFKYIGEQIKNFETTGENYVFGFEESYGYLAGTHARDKDAVVSAMLICEMAAYYKSKGKTLVDALASIYEKYGYYKEETKSVTLKGIEGAENIKKIMESLRTNPPKELGSYKVLKMRDYKASVETDIETGSTDKITLPVSDVLYYVLEDDSWFCVRPSGTEPKIKIYFGTKAPSESDANAKIKKVTDAAMAYIQ